MHLFNFVAFLAATVVAVPVPEDGDASLEKRADRGSYTVGGLGSRKQAILNAGGNTLDIAIAMLESERISTDYAYGDNKRDDAANFGLFKQNWGMLRECAWRAGFKGQSQGQWNNGNRLNWDIYADVASRWDCQEHYGRDKWFAGHRNGATGLANPYTPDIERYKSAIQWIQGQIDSSWQYRSDDTRFWVDVPAI